MKNTIEETTRLMLNGTLPKDEGDKILLALHNVSHFAFHVMKLQYIYEDSHVIVIAKNHQEVAEKLKEQGYTKDFEILSTLPFIL